MTSLLSFKLFGDLSVFRIPLAAVAVFALSSVAVNDVLADSMASQRILPDKETAASGRFVQSPDNARSKLESVKQNDSQNREILFIDSAVPDGQALLQSVGSNVDVITIDGWRGGLEQIADALAGRSDIKAIHIISHGGSGKLMLGASVIDTAALERDAPTLSAIGKVLSDDGDILLYGCDVAAGVKGEAFIRNLAETTGADVSASTDVTGRRQLGGNWVLEARSGNIETVALNLPGYEGLLAAFTEDFSSVPASPSGMVTGDYIESDGGYLINGSSATTGAVNYITYTENGVDFRITLNDTGDGMVLYYRGAYGESNSPSLEFDSGRGDGTSMPQLGTTESFTITRADGQPFTLGSLWLDAQSNSAITITATLGGSTVTTQNIAASTAAQTYSFGNVGVDTVTFSSADFWYFELDSFIGDDSYVIAPTISIDNTTLAYTENDAVTKIDSAATLSDSNGDADWNGGTLAVQITANNEAADEISIPDNVVGTINTSGLDILNGATTIGTLSAIEGTVTNGNKLTITFNANATNTLVQQVLRAIHYRNTSDAPGTANRTVTFTATDKSSASASDTRTISVTAVNDPPTLTSFTSAITTTDEDVEATITVANLSAQGNEADVDGTVTAYAVQAVSSGTLKIGASAGTAAAYDAVSNYTIDATNNAYWTPAANAFGTLNAFTVKAKDNGGALSATAVQTQVSVTAVADTPSVTGATTNEDTQSSSGLVISRNGVDGSEVTHFKISSISGGTLYKNPTDGGAQISDGDFITFAEGNNGLRFTPSSNSTADGSFNVQAGTDGVGSGLSTGSATATITVTPVNDAPTLTNLNGDSVSFTVGGNAVTLDTGGNATLADIDSADFNGGNVTASITANGQAGEDVLAIGNVGNISTSGSNVNHSDGVTIGTFTGGTAVSNLVITLNANATVARVRDLISALQYYDSAAATVNTLTRTVRITVDDGDGGSSTSANQDVTVSLVRAPIIDLDLDNSSGATGSDFNGSFVEDGGAVATADSDTTISDDGTFKSLTVTQTNHPDGTAESLSSSYGIGAQSVNGEAVTIGTYNSTTGVLTISVDDASTSAATMQMLMGSIRYDNASDVPDTSVRAVSYVVVDNADNAGSAAMAYITISPANDAPLFSGLDANASFTEGGSAVVLDGNVTITDPELDAADNYAGAVLNLARNGGADANDVFSASGSLSALTEGGGFNLGGSDIGTVTTNSGGSLALTFNTNATAANVDTVLQSIAYSNASDNPATSVQIDWSFSDGNSGAQGSGGALVATGFSSVTITPVNDAPTITGQATLTMPSDTTLAITLGDLTVTDPDNSYPTGFSLSLGGGTNYSISSGDTVIPDPAYVGNLTVPVTVSDGTNDSVAFNLLVTVTLGNTAPTISGTPATTVAGHTPYSFVPTANDVDSDPLTFIITNKPTWASFNTATGELSGTPTNSDIGTTTGIVIQVNDGTVSTSLSAFALTVTENLDIDGDGMPNDWETANGFDPLDPSDAALDKDGDGLTNLEEYQASKEPASDDNPPVITPPADVTVDAAGLFTVVDIGTATAVDALDGVLTASSNAPTHFKPGTYTVTWSATDNAGNKGTATQTVNVNPLISFGKPQTVSEGSTASFSLFLNGPAANYPVTVPYTVSGTASTDGSDHSLLNGTVTLLSGTEAQISFTTVDDGAGEGTEQIVITMGTPTNAAAGSTTVHTIDIVEGNVAPMVTLSAEQGAVPVTTVVVVDGQVTVSSAVADPNPADTHTYDWSGSDNVLIDVDGANDTFTFDPATLSPGVYTLKLSVSDGSASDDAQLSLKVVAAAPALSAASDSDGDGIDDVAEGYGDTDGDGIADYLDAIDSSNVLQELSGVSDSYLIEVEPGLQLKLGTTAIGAGLGQASITTSDVTGSGIAMADANYAYNNGLFDFSVEQLPVAGQTVQLVLPQSAAIPAGASYRTVVTGMWQTFVVDTNNHVASAPGEAGYCPPPGDAAYTAGLTEGHWCVQLTIEDGGPNDGDGLANNSVVDPGGIATDATQPITVKVSSGGGAGSLWLLSLLGLLLWRMEWVRRGGMK